MRALELSQAALAALSLVLIVVVGYETPSLIAVGLTCALAGASVALRRRRGA